MEAEDARAQGMASGQRQTPDEVLFQTQVELVTSRVESVSHSLRAAASALEALAVPVRQLQAISRGARF
ncbi:MAG TPA: hypothetical protein VFR37_17270 [Longimicrobium sp.]|nr:hypothetical protein [Longimicrobium sp.]